MFFHQWVCECYKYSNDLELSMALKKEVKTQKGLENKGEALQILCYPQLSAYSDLKPLGWFKNLKAEAIYFISKYVTD